MCDQITLTDHHESVLSAARHTIEINDIANGAVSALDWTVSGSLEDQYDVIVAAGNGYHFTLTYCCLN